MDSSLVVSSPASLKDAGMNSWGCVVKSCPSFDGHSLSAVCFASGCGKCFWKKQRITLACDLTLQSEQIFRGTVAAALKSFGHSKREFILVIHNH